MLQFRVSGCLAKIDFGCVGVMRRFLLATVLSWPRLLGSGCVSGKSTHFRLGPICALACESQERIVEWKVCFDIGCK